MWKIKSSDLAISTVETHSYILIATDCFIICLCNWYHLLSSLRIIGSVGRDCGVIMGIELALVTHCSALWFRTVSLLLFSGGTLPWTLCGVN